MKAAGIIFNDARHYLDHLAPYCSLQKWPLILCEESLVCLAKTYYPNLEIIETNLEKVILPPTIVTCAPKALIESFFGRKISNKCLWLPHGHSDKGWDIASFSALQEEIALVYGQRMIDVMKEQFASCRTIRVGNFRLRYWLHHRSFYDPLIMNTLSRLPKQLTYLYAPTWDDLEGNGSFWPMFTLLSSHLPNHCNLIVKLHPNTYQKDEAKIERLIGQHANRENILFLLDFPPIYSLLSLCDAYIGDMSSIGYDFLYWNRPMFFLNTKQLDRTKSKQHPIFQCGIEINAENIPSIFQFEQMKNLQFTSIRKMVYADTFTHSLTTEEQKLLLNH